MQITENPQQRKPPYVNIKIDDKKIEVSYGFQLYFKKNKSGKMSCAIPALNIFYSAIDKETMMKKCDIFSSVFFDHFLTHSGKSGMRKLGMNLHNLGYKPYNGSSGLVKIMRNQETDSRFKNTGIVIPEEFENAETTLRESQVEMAI